MQRGCLSVGCPYRYVCMHNLGEMVGTGFGKLSEYVSRIGISRLVGTNWNPCIEQQILPRCMGMLHVVHSCDQRDTTE